MMLSSLLRPNGQRQTDVRRPLLFGRGEPANEESSDPGDGYQDEEEASEPNFLNRRETRAILPLFSAEHLDRIPVYHLQHSIRLLVIGKWETTLSWDQLRSPQVSQFLVKPILQKIRASHSNKATLYALLANSLQFQKDGQMNPGTVGLSKTRALICELLAMRILRDYSTRELIDALFYDFDPLQGLPRPGNMTSMNRSKNVTRLSTVEIAIRSHAKRFLAHPLVVQQLEAVWAGTIVFHSAADTLHRTSQASHPWEPASRPSGYGAVSTPVQFRTISYAEPPQRKGKAPAKQSNPVIRKTVTLYDPSQSSIFKLSRLRVPRYRQLFSTLSYALMIGLFLAVLVQRSHDITALELLFWFWSAGYMLDEVVGFSEQGFSLYFISVWNSFDIGILLMFIVYYILRLYAIIIPDDTDDRIINLSYDVLASTAILLFPRLFSVLDHYKYFSQLLIAFRMMAVDLTALMILIIISCSGFFVAFTLSFNGTKFRSFEAAYVLFQILMGFTPAAWEIWDDYNILGKAILTAFLIICHFLIVTILITVLTNSFMAIVQNANEEHQFLFAVNTISMVKSDALFSYVPPSNIIGWMLSPARFVMPFRSFVKLNRTIIKITHIPVLFAIFLYERVMLSRRIFEPTDLVEQRGREPSRVPGFSIRGPGDIFSPGARLREPSVATYHKDQALEEVFRRPFQEVVPDKNDRTRPFVSRTKTESVVEDWMNNVAEGGAGSPMNDPQGILSRLESRKPSLRRRKTHTGTSRLISEVRSTASDPEEHAGPIEGLSYFHPQDQYTEPSMSGVSYHTDDDGDDELATNDEDEAATQDRSFEDLARPSALSDKENRQYLTPSRPAPTKSRKPLGSLRGSAIMSSDEGPVTPLGPRIGRLKGGSDSESIHSSPAEPETTKRIVPSKPDRGQHIRTTSSATILFAPLEHHQSSSKTPFSSTSPTKSKHTSAHTTNPATTLVPNTPNSPTFLQYRRQAKSIPPLTDSFGSPLLTKHKKSNNSAPNLATFLALSQHDRNQSFSAQALDLASDLGDNRTIPDTPGLLSASFGTHLEKHRRRIAARGLRSVTENDDADASNNEDEEDEDADEDDRLAGMLMGRRSRDDGGARRLNRLMLARMATLEEGFREMLREVRGISSSVGRASKTGIVAGSETVAASAMRESGGDRGGRGSV